MTLTLAAAYARHPDSRGSFLTFPVQLSHEHNKIACTSGYSFNVRTVPAVKSATPTSLAADAAAAAAACKWNSKNSHSLFLGTTPEWSPTSERYNGGKTDRQGKGPLSHSSDIPFILVPRARYNLCPPVLAGSLFPLNRVIYCNLCVKLLPQLLHSDLKDDC